jgi:hypothetical protein
MRQKTLEVGQIEVVVEGFFTTHHELRTQTGSLGKITFPAFSDYGVLRTTDGRELQMRKPKMLSSALELVQDGIVRGRSDRMGLFDQRKGIEYNGQVYKLQPEGIFKQGWFLTTQENIILAEIQPRGVFKQGASITIRGAVDADLVAFAYYLFHMNNQEQAAVVASTAAS